MFHMTSTATQMYSFVSIDNDKLLMTNVIDVATVIMVLQKMNINYTVVAENCMANVTYNSYKIVVNKELECGFNTEEELASNLQSYRFAEEFVNAYNKRQEDLSLKLTARVEPSTYILLREVKTY